MGENHFIIDNISPLEDIVGKKYKLKDYWGWKKKSAKANQKQTELKYIKIKSGLARDGLKWTIINKR